jgi:hypothetical protein
MTPKRPLSNATLRQAGKQHTHVFQLNNHIWSLAGEDFYRVLVCQVVRTFNGIEGVRFPGIFGVHVLQRCSYASLCGNGVGTNGVGFGNEGYIQLGVSAFDFQGSATAS